MVHVPSSYVINNVLPPDPAKVDGQDFCNIYYVNKRGTVECDPGVPILCDVDQAEETHEGDAETRSSIRDPRLTLCHLPTSFMTRLVPEDVLPKGKEWRWPVSQKIREIPPVFKQKLASICSICGCKSDVLWRNFQKLDPQFSCCFRYVEDKQRPSERRCFLKLYTIRVPILAQKHVVLSMVHHIRAEDCDFISREEADGNNQEHMLAFVSGFSSDDIGDIFNDLFPRWQDIEADHAGADSAGITPKLFLATVISQYGSIVSRDIVLSKFQLDVYDKELNDAATQPRTPEEMTESIKKMNRNLIDMHRNLTGTRSVMHFLVDSVDLLVKRISEFDTYVDARLQEWKGNTYQNELRISLQALDSYKERLRDKDKLEMIRKTMQQYKVDIKALKQHIDINVGIVLNLIAEKDRSIQSTISKNTHSDSFIMKILAILTILLLPATVVANILAAPMFDFATDKTSAIVRAPFGIFWQVTATLTCIFVLCVVILSIPDWLKVIIDAIPNQMAGEYLRKTRLYDILLAKFHEKNERFGGAVQSTTEYRLINVNSQDVKENAPKTSSSTYAMEAPFATVSRRFWFPMASRVKEINGSRV